MENIDELIEQMDSEESERIQRDRRLTYGNRADGTNDSDGETKNERADEDGYLNFETFKKVDLRVARILDVAEHKGARKHMYRLRLDVGELGERNIVAGIGDYYTKEELVGREIVIVANLKPRNIAGVESNGMLLAAENGDVVALLSPDRELAEGSAVH